VRVIELARNFKQTAAMQAGIDAARGDVIVTMDGDLQDDPDELPRFLDALADGNDLVNALADMIAALVEENDELSTVAVDLKADLDDAINARDEWKGLAEQLNGVVKEWNR
jgi:glycosyltransferase involved in cell wall biosynthesis